MKEVNNTSILPPCQVCAGDSSGYHYGANTCEACKGFFRRSLQRSIYYLCQNNKACDVTGYNRILCSFCRYQKCLHVGMSKKAIKTGRYSHEKRTRNILEVKRLQEKEISQAFKDNNKRLSQSKTQSKDNAPTRNNPGYVHDDKDRQINVDLLASRQTIIWSNR
uniref:Nuclear receptor domain-containing protein n=1 Tax=Biomphalaria glabrata TaxID=6526 RepID=A0A2C9L271_BIOGL